MTRMGNPDFAAGYAAMTVVPASASVQTVEYKMNLMQQTIMVMHGKTEK